MSESIITRRGGGALSTLPILNANYPEDKSVTFISGNTASATFEVKIDVAGNPAEYTYQWYVDGQPVSGANSASYTWSGTTGGTHSVYCKVTNKAGTVQSRTATLSVVRYYKPVLNSSYPSNVTTDRANANITLKIEIATAGNPTSYTYQWYKNGTAISGATSSTYTFSRTNAIGTYTFYCKVTNTAGTVQSRTATVVLTDTFLFNNGDQCTALTGGYEHKGQQGCGVNYGSTIEFYFSYDYGREGVCYSKKKVNLTNYKQLCFDVNVTYQGGYSFSVGCLSSNGYQTSPSFTAKQTVTTTGQRTMTVDVSGLSGEYYIGIHMDVAKAHVSKIYMKM